MVDSERSTPRLVEPSQQAILTSNGPALAMPADIELRLVWKEGAGDQRIWSSFRLGNGLWSPPTVIDGGINLNASPTLASDKVFYL
ncbi:MAG TPA: hypothetical protein VGN34_21140 [Ktedonobacteraceae bacterium]